MARPSTMPRPKNPDRELQLSFVSSEDVRARLDVMAERMSAAAAGAGVSRADVLRAAVEEGLRALEAKYPAPHAPRKR